MEKMVEDAWFCLEGDNVLFRGVDAGEKCDGYDCPLFGLLTGLTVANYISTERKTVFFDQDEWHFVLDDDGERFDLRVYEVDETYMYDFGGWPWKRCDIRENPT